MQHATTTTKISAPPAHPRENMKLAARSARQKLLRPTLWRHRDELRDLPPRFDCRGRNWPEDPGACVVEHLRKNDVVPESGEAVVETPHVSPTVVGRAGFFVVVVPGLVVWMWARRWRA